MLSMPLEIGKIQVKKWKIEYYICSYFTTIKKKSK